MYEGLKHFMDYKDSVVYLADSFTGLPSRSQELLEPQLAKVASLGFQRPLNQEFTADVAEHIRDGNLLIISTNDHVTGFASNRAMPELDAVYISGIVKSSEAPSGIVERVLQNYMKYRGPRRIITRTQNDRVVDIVVSLCNETVPVDRGVTSEELDMIKRTKLLSGHEDLSPDLIIRGGYGGSLIQSGIPLRSSNPIVRRATDKLDYFNGDYLVLLGYF